MVLFLVALAVVLSLFGAANMTVFAADDQSYSKQQAVLLSRRSQIQQQIQSAEQRLRQLEIERSDKLEELGELNRARSELAQRRQFSKAVDDEIAVQTDSLRRIEEQRSDCLEELDGLYIGLSQINHDVADSSKASQ